MGARIPVLLAAAVMAALTFPQPGAAVEEKWVTIHRDATSTFSYDRGGISRDDRTTFTVSTRVEYTPKGKAEAVELLDHPPGFDDLAATEYLQIIDCALHQNRLLKVTHFDISGAPITTTDLSRIAEWEKLVEGSRMGAVAAEECRE